MKAIIITIGDEILMGQILDTNSQYIAPEFDRYGGRDYRDFIDPG